VTPVSRLCLMGRSVVGYVLDRRLPHRCSFPRIGCKRMVRTHLIYPVPTEEPAVAGIGWTIITTTYRVAQSPSLGTWETLSMMLRRAELRSWKHLLKSSDASRGSQRGHSSPRAGKPFHMAKGHSLRGGCVVIASDDKAWESLPRPTEHSGPKILSGGGRMR
jgi:hypothetical protein